MVAHIVGLARSNDLVHWSKYEHNPLWLNARWPSVLPDADKATDPAHWLRLCADHGVTVWNSVPAIVAMLHEAAGGPVPDGAGSLAALPGNCRVRDLPVRRGKSQHAREQELWLR